MAKLSRKSRAAREAVASVIVVGASSTSAGPSSPSAESRPPPLEHATVNRTRSSLRSNNFPRKDANPASAGTTSSLIKRKQEDTAQLPNKRPRQKNPEMDPAIVESGEDTHVDPAVLNVMNEFSKSKTRSASRTETPKIEVRLRSSNNMGDLYTFPPRKRVKPISPTVSPLPEDEDQGETRERGPQPEPESELEADHEGERIEDGNQLEAEVDGEVDGEAEQPGDELFVKQTQPSQPVLKHIHSIARPTPSTISSKPQLFKPRLNRARETDKLYDVMEEDEEGVQVSSNPSSTSLHRKQTINNLQAPQLRLNVTRLPSKPWINADDEGFGYPGEALRAKKDTAGGTSRKAQSRLEKPLRPPVAMELALAPAPAPALAPRARAQQKSVASRARRSPTLEPARQRRIATSPHRSPSPQRARTHPVDPSSESGTAEETDEDGHPMPPQPTVPMSRTAVVAMHQIMGRAGWTNRQKNWAKHLAPGATESEHGTPGTTSYGRQMFQYLTNLNRALNKIPKAPYFAKQAKYLVAHDAEHRKMFFETKRLLTKIREERLAPIGDSDRRANGDLEQRRGMVHDILHYLMPMLVLTVWTTFSLGGVEHDTEGHAQLSEEGTFTDITLGYVVKFSHWMHALMETLELELSVRPFEDDSAAGKKEKDRARESFRDALDHWFLEFEEAQEAVNELATGGERRARQLEEDLRIKEAQRREEQKQEAETERRWREMAASTQRIARLPNPLQEKWERATGESGTPTASTSSGRSERTLSTEAPAATQYPPWPIEDRLWLMGELRRVKGVFRRHNGQPGDEEMQFFADTLERPVEEVTLEIEAQKRACRALARERGLPLELWAA
ncbi:hypothetical protein B0T18DRAFT_190414 [Schizothecium vesticola]|uniref:Uncharacterized protein n=1 Tax=Schizothecium vesticola TaxID=314040 RepID=A0AA40EQP9_9PEZI|nr:hypothetical protein B0T18DRAFT_190414 [Schizothecium vesticola]